MQEALQIDPDIIDMLVKSARGYLQNGYTEQDIKFKLRKRFDEHEIDEALRIIRSENTSSEETASLRESQRYYGWYDKPKEGPGYHWPALKQHLSTQENAWTSDMVESLDRASTTVVSHLAPPMSENPITVKGLVLGYIQSGKTANFSATISKAVDEGYKLVIVLAGMHNNLRKQTESRLRSELVNPHEGKTCTTLTDVDDNGDFKRRQPVSANSQLSRNDGFVLVVLKKNSSVLRNFNRWLDEASVDVLKNCPTLIIDDESDQASINTNKADQDPTAINSHIRSLIGRFHVVSYIGYTATPFANVFIDSSIKEDIYPKDFLVTLEKPNTYYGPEELFGRNSVNGRESTEGLPVIRTIPNDQAETLRKLAKGKASLEELPESLKLAVDHFILGGAARLSRGQWKSHITMLVHISHLTDSHSKIFSLIESYIEVLSMDFEDDDESARERFQTLWQTDFYETTESIGTQVETEFKSVWKNARKFIGSLELIMDNSNSNERLSFDTEAREGEPVWAIVVGGNTLSRGLTLEGLTTSFFIRNSKAYDTLLQMGRWFGYRKGYVDLTRIFVPHDLYCNFYELATIEQEIRDEIGLMAANEERPIDVAVRIRKIPNMIVTANNKSRNTKTTFMSYSGTKVQTHQVVANDSGVIDRNKEAVESLLSNAKNLGLKTSVNFSDLDKSHLFQKLPSEYVMQFLDSIFVPKSNSKFVPKLLQDYISDRNAKGELQEWSVALMSLKNGESIKVSGLDVIPVNRNVKHEAIGEENLIESTLRAVSTPGEELIDLFQQIDGSPASTDKVLQSETGPKLSDVKARYKYRPKSTGLILIYPLKSNVGLSESEFQKLKKETKPSFPLKASGQIFGVSIVFPYSEKRSGPRLYIQNESV